MPNKDVSNIYWGKSCDFQQCWSIVGGLEAENRSSQLFCLWMIFLVTIYPTALKLATVTKHEYGYKTLIQNFKFHLVPLLCSDKFSIFLPILAPVYTKKKAE